MQRTEIVVSSQSFGTDIGENLGERRESEDEAHGFGGEGNHLV